MSDRRTPTASSGERSWASGRPPAAEITLVDPTEPEPTPPPGRGQPARADRGTVRHRSPARGYGAAMIFGSPLGDVDVPAATLPAFVLEHAEERGDRAAIVDGPTGRVVSHGDVARGVRSLAAALAARGFGKGDVLALCAPNTPEYAIAFHAAAALGGIVTTINPAYTAEEIGFQLRDAAARVVVAGASFADRVREAGAA